MKSLVPLIKQSHKCTTSPKTTKRPGLIVCDDIDEEENMGNQSIGKRRMEKIIWLGNLIHPNYSICQFQELILSEMRADNPGLDVTYQITLKTHQKAILRFSLEDMHGKSIWGEQYSTGAYLIAVRYSGLRIITISFRG